MNKNDILFEDQNDFTFKCARCNKTISVEYGFEYGVQYSQIVITEMTHPSINSLRTQSFAFICNDCLKNIKKDIEFI